jgi:hypothetical protein
MAEYGYETKTTFWDDFSIADRFGTTAIIVTFTRAFDEWKDNTEYVTELAMVLNHKAWYFSARDAAVSELYVRLWQEVDAWCIDNLKDDDLTYYLKTTD